MRALALTLAALAGPASPGELGSAMEHDPGTVAAASFAVHAAPATTAVGGAASATTFPLHGETIAYLSNGDASAGFTGAQADNLSHALGTEARGGHDVTVLSLRIDAPEDANCLTLGASFFSEDYGDGRRPTTRGSSTPSWPSSTRPRRGPPAPATP